MKAYQHLIQYALNNGHTVSVWDGEEWQEKKSTDSAACAAAVESVEEAQIKIRDSEGEHVGWALVSAYGLMDDETVMDYGVNDYMDAWQAAYDQATAAEPLTLEQIREAAAELRTGRHGSFAAAIGEAATYADSLNLSRLAGAFPEIFAKTAAANLMTKQETIRSIGTHLSAKPTV